MDAVLTSAAKAAWAVDTLAGLADSGLTLADGMELLVGRISFAADGPAFIFPPGAGDPQEFAALAAEYGDVPRLGGPPLAYRRTASRSSNWASGQVYTPCCARD
jgi:hypothetical protein